MNNSESWEAVIGLETHVQLNTKSKIFTSASTVFGDDPNTHIDPVVCGLPRFRTRFVDGNQFIGIESLSRSTESALALPDCAWLVGARFPVRDPDHGVGGCGATPQSGRTDFRCSCVVQ